MSIGQNDTVNKSCGRRWLQLIAAAGLTFASLAATASPYYRAEVRRSSFGIPHIKADNEAGLGYGIGHAYAEDNVCLLADALVTANGQRSRYFGPDALTPGFQSFQLKNETADYLYSLLNDPVAVQIAWQRQIPQVRQLLEGYAAGYNRFLRERGGSGLPAACANANWVRPITALDLVRLMRRYSILNSSGIPILANGLIAAAPPVQGAGPAANIISPPAASQQATTALPAGMAEFLAALRPHTGSNAVALGHDATANGRGILYGNPHFPWEGELRLYELHLTIPGRLDAMGITLPGLPIVGIGFTRNFAWSSTTTSSLHFTFFALDLLPQDPTKYVVDGKIKSMRPHPVTILAKEADGSLRPRSHTFYESEFGPVISIPEIPALQWSTSTAFAIRDANWENWRMVEQFYAMDRATTLDELAGSVERVVGNPWSNIIATDSAGHTSFQQISPVPNLSPQRLQTCVPEAYRQFEAGSVFVLSGNTEACQWEIDPTVPQPGIIPGKRLPQLRRADFVQNSNNSAWMTNPAAPLTGFSPLVSIDGAELAGRTRLGITQIQARLAGRDGLPGNRFTLKQFENIALNDHVYYAGVLMNDLLTLCNGAAGSTVDLAPACRSLADWDRSTNLDAGIGYGYFSDWFQQAVQIPNYAAVPFDPADPVNTPRGLNLADPGASDLLLTALKNAVQAVPGEGWSPQTKWGDLQQVVGGDLRIPMHGGPDAEGVYNVIQNVPGPDHIRAVNFGSSYIQAVTFEDDGSPRVDSFLTYSQSTDPRSPHFADQTQRFSRKEWIRLPFTQAQIEADPGYSVCVLSE